MQYSGHLWTFFGPFKANCIIYSSKMVKNAVAQNTVKVDQWCNSNWPKYVFAKLSNYFELLVQKKHCVLFFSKYWSTFLAMCLFLEEKKFELNILCRRFFGGHGYHTFWEWETNVQKKERQNYESIATTLQHHKKSKRVVTGLGYLKGSSLTRCNFCILKTFVSFQNKLCSVSDFSPWIYMLGEVNI